MMSEELKQGTDAWKQARCGSLGASNIADALARTKTGWGASCANMAAQLVVERLTGSQTEGYTNAAMLWGQEKEAEARTAYAFLMGIEVEEVGLIVHPTIRGTHASPDGLVGEDGLVELKCPNSATHIETLLGAPIDGRYIKQVMWQMACTGRAFVDWVSYDPRMPEPMRLFVKRIPRDKDMIRELELEVIAFLAEVDSNVVALRDKYLEQAAA